MPGDEPDNREAERAFGGQAPPSSAEAFGAGRFAPPAVPSGPPVPPPPPAAAPPVAPGEPAPTSTWPPARDPATTPGHSSTWPPPAGGQALRNADGATASLVLGIISWVLCPIVCSIPAIVLARQARAEIDASPTPLAGRDNASAGFWLGVSSLIVYGLLTVWVIVSAAVTSA